MKLLLAASLVAVSATPVEGADAPAGTAALLLRPKAGVAAVVPSVPRASAPFVVPGGEEANLRFTPQDHDPRRARSRSSCDSDRVLCYDPDSGRIVYKPARALMPDIPGLTRENISVKRDRIVFRYSF